MENEYLKEIERLKAELDKYRWIPASERLPKNGELVWIALPVSFNDFGWIYDTDHYYVGDGFFVHDDASHWMPLPDPPSNKTPAGDD